MTQALSDANFPKLLDALDQALEEGANPVAAFDADNTLWDIDVGEVFFEYLIKNQLVSGLPDDPFAHYFGLRNGPFPPEGYLWLAQILEGVPEEQAHQWSMEAAEKAGIPTFKSMHRLIDHLRIRDVEIYIVTASVKWAVVGAAKAYNIPPKNIAGVKTQVVDGVITNEQDGPITWKQGKPDGLMSLTNGIPAFFSAGNSSGDIFLLDAATHCSLAVRTVSEGHMIYDSEEELHQLAIERGWWTHDHRS